MAAETKNGARGGAAAARSRAARPTRAQLEQKAKGQPAMLVNLRIVMSATAVTILVLLFVFGGIGFLLLARSPQEPLVSKIDISPPLVAPAKLDPPSQAKIKTVPVPAPVVEAPQVKTEETVAAPPPAKKEEPPIAAAPKKNETMAAPQNPVPAPLPDPQTTATVPPVQQTEPKVEPEQRPAVQRQRVIRHAPPPKKAEPQFTNPFYRLFDGR